MTAEILIFIVACVFIGIGTLLGKSVDMYKCYTGVMFTVIGGVAIFMLFVKYAEQLPSSFKHDSVLSLYNQD